MPAESSQDSARSDASPLRTALADTWPLLLGMGVLMLGAGLQGTLLGLRATLEGFPTWATGAVMSCYYLGYIASSAVTPRLVARVGHIRVFSALTAVAATAILIQGAFVQPLLWAVVRAASGFCFAGIYVVAESWLNDRASNRDRGSLLSAYMVILYGGLGAGQFLLTLADPRSADLFMLVAGLISIALVPLALSARRTPDFHVPGKIGIRHLWRVSPLGCVGVTVSGMISGTMFAIGPVYAGLIGLGTAGVATFMSAWILAAVLFQLPLGRLSDRTDRRTILVAICLLASAAAAVAAWLGPRSVPGLLTLSALFGGLVLSVYSIALSHVNDHLSAAQRVDASGTVVLLNGAGAVCGPVAVALLIEGLGARAYFVSLATLAAWLGLAGLWRKSRRAPVPLEEKAPFVSAQPQVPVAPLAASGPETPSETD